MSEDPIIQVRGLSRFYAVRGGVFRRQQGQVRAVDSVSLELRRGETLGLVGESGCGKSTLGKSIVRLVKPTGGQVLFNGTDLASLSARRLKPFRREVQMIFQDPADSLNSRHTVGSMLEEPFLIHGIGEPASRREKALELLRIVGLPPAAIDRFPFEFSGGQRQRIGIARAIALNPKLIICDEPVSALDASIQSQILNLLLDLQERLKLSYLFIAHDLAVVKHVSDRIAIMYLGHVVESGDGEEVYRHPRHPYTRALISAIPQPVPRRQRYRQVLSGEVPSPIDPPPGCPFQTRCPHVQPVCREQLPALREVGGVGPAAHAVACHFDL